ncbi:MBL fold metallo-hydrolase [Enterovibrio sp. 27052020O]|uniref:MBL fold metallo-hydrolase n=1 Tax=Enterovibrio sp. 27052020O TaxID=3241166 RepID=UPI00388D928C
MKTRIALLTTLLAGQAFAADMAPLTLDVYYGDENSFMVTSTLVQGETEAVLIDTGFTKADALRIAAKVLDSGKELKTIFISQADPDYYFGAEVIHQFFPNAEIITTPAVKKVIEKKLAGKVAFWGPKMGANAPVKPIVPEAVTVTSFSVNGTPIEIKGTEGVLAHRPYLWLPANKAILGNVGVFEGIHGWMADTQTDAEVAAWTAQLKEMQALQPQVVVPGHTTPDSSLNAEAIDYSLSYISDFVEAKKSSKDSKSLIETMMKSYPDAAEPSSLDLSAKVHTGEMKW